MQQSALDFSWRFCFYLIAFVAGLACVINVSIDLLISDVSNVLKAFLLYLIVCLRMSSGYSCSAPTHMREITTFFKVYLLSVVCGPSVVPIQP